MLQGVLADFIEVRRTVLYEDFPWMRTSGGQKALALWK